MVASASQTIIFRKVGSDSDSEECPSILFEIPDTGIPCGAEMSIYLWGISNSVLSGYTLEKDDDDMGSGKVKTESETELTEDISFGESNSFQLKRPIDSITSTNMDVAKKGVYNDDGELTGIEDYEGDYVKKGGSCIGPSGDTKIYGHGSVTYKSAKYRRTWKWTVDCSRRDHWFFIYKDDKIIKKFSIAVDADSATISVPRLVRIKPIDSSSEAPIPDATVYIDGVEEGTTNEDGYIDVELTSGTTYGLKITADGFADTDEDGIDNDQIYVN